ncbi:MAG: nitronate monooxygenase [Burkholderiales bacterium]|nr:nitronate monooxygenase [Burkholderiales bacterium]
MITTALTRMFELEHPLILGPMGGVAGGRLAAAVSNAGGLGLVGAGYGDPQWVARELDLVGELSHRPWGIGFITWSTAPELLELALARKPAAVMLSFGDPRPLGARIKAAGCRLICQVQDLAGARLAHEAGGHASRRATLPLVPAVANLVAPIPVVAAGGIADGRGLAAALMLGAEGALLGTRFYASDEALGSARAKALIASASGDATARTTVFDIVRRLDWPPGYDGRALRNRFMGRWQGHENELAGALASENPAFLDAVQAQDFDTAMVWAGEAVDLIDAVEPAAEIVRRIGREAEIALARGAALCRYPN